MPQRYIRNTAILAKIETTYGVDSVPTGAANAMLVSNLSINPLNAQNIDRDLIRPYFGGSEQLVGTANLQCSFDVELAGSGSAGTAPAWDPLLRACGFAAVVTAGQRVEYNPVSTGQEAVTIYWFDDGVRHILLGARGTVQIRAGLSERPVLSFTFTGIDGGVTSQALPSTTLTGFRTPLPITDANTGDITLGCTYTTGTLSAGTPYPSRGIDLDVGNVVNHMPLLGGESVEITGRSITGSFQLDLTAAQEVSLMSTVKTNTVQSLGLTHGTAAGNTVVLFAPAVQLINPSKPEMNGKRLVGYEARLLPSSGNDELRICVR